DVERRPGRAADDRHARQHRQLRRAGTKEMQAGGEGWPHPEAEGSAHAAEAHHLDEAGPQEGLLESGSLEDPRAEVPERAEPGSEAAEEHPAEDEEGKLDRVKQVGGEREPETLEDVDVGADADALREILLRPFARIESCQGLRDHHVLPRARSGAGLGAISPLESWRARARPLQPPRRARA